MISDEKMPGPTAVRGRLAEQRRRKTLASGLKAFLRAVAVWLLLLAGVMFAPWWAKIPLALLNGAVIGTLFIVGHDAGHGSLFPKRWMNRLAGRISLLPALHPFSAWVHNHNGLHHAFTNIKEKDPGFPPLDPTEYAALSRLGRWLYRIKRTWYGLGLLYFLDMWVKWEVFPTAARAPRNPRAFLRDRLLVLAFAIAWIGSLVASAFWLGENPFLMVLVGFVLPQATWNWFIGFMILLQHTHPLVPWYSELDSPSPHYFQNQVRATPHLIFPRAFRGIVRSIMEHTAHHADPAVPHYELESAQTEIETAYPTDVIVQTWNLRDFLSTLRTCRLYDYATHRWLDYDGTPLTGSLHGAKPTAN